MAILNNFVVQVLLGIGGMVFLITLGEAIRGAAARHNDNSRKEEQLRIRAGLQQEIQSLRQQMDDLKSTLLEHSMSLDSNVEGLKYRVENLERKSMEVANRG